MLWDLIIGKILEDEKINEAAKQEASCRHELTSQGKTPKMAQGWLTGRRWEDEGHAITDRRESFEEYMKRTQSSKFV